MGDALNLQINLGKKTTDIYALDTVQGPGGAALHKTGRGLPIKLRIKSKLFTIAL